VKLRRLFGLENGHQAKQRDWIFGREVPAVSFCEEEIRFLIEPELKPLLLKEVER
jgi:hypothetical protein